MNGAAAISALLLSVAPSQDGSGLTQLAARAVDADPAVAWAAIVELGAFSIGAKEKKEAEKLASVWAGELELEAEDARVLRAHALGALREHAGAAAPDLARAMAGDGSPGVRLACALALIRIGDDGEKASAKHLHTDDLVGAALACAVVAGTVDAKGGMARLEKAAGDTGELRGYLLSEPAIVALELAGRDVEKRLAKRKNAAQGLRVPRGARFNWAGIVPLDPAGLLVFRAASGEKDDPRTTSDYELPAETRCAWETGTAVGLYADGLGHLARLGRELHPALDAGGAPTWAGYVKLVEKWRNTIELLMDAERALVPAEK